MSAVVLKGQLVKSAGPCQGFLAEGGDRYWIVGDFSGAKVEENLYVIGTIADASICGDEPTIIASWIGKQLPSATPVEVSVTRDIEVTATHSTRDPSPTFKLEGREQPLTYDNEEGKWKGKYPSFIVSGNLSVTFVSEAWNNQKFDVAVTATDPQTSKAKSKTFTGFGKKGEVVIQGDMEV